MASRAWPSPPFSSAPQNEIVHRNIQLCAKHAHLDRYVDNIAYIFGNAAATYIIAGTCMHGHVRAHARKCIDASPCEANACLHRTRGGLLALRHNPIERLPCRTRPLWPRMLVHARTRASAHNAYARPPYIFLHNVQTVHLYYSESFVPPALQRLLKKDE